MSRDNPEPKWGISQLHESPMDIVLFTVACFGLLGGSWLVVCLIDFFKGL